MERIGRLLLSVLVLGRLLAGADALPIVIKQVDPNAGRSKAGVVMDVADVDLVVDERGVPFSLESSVGLPDYAVRALEQWRYSPYKKKGRNVPFSSKLTVPIAWPLTPSLERSLAVFWHPSTPEIGEAVKHGRMLNEAEAEAMHASLSDAEAVGNSRTLLLVYYSTAGAKDIDKARNARASLLGWLVEHDPKSDILGSPFAIINRSGEPLADAATNLKLTNMWVDLAARYPDDKKVTSNALNFLQTASPQSALAVLATFKNTRNELFTWTGDVYGLAAIGVDALSPATGKPVDVLDSLSSGAIAANAREMLLKSDNTKMVLAGLLAMTWAGRSLAMNQRLPAAYGDFCPKLLAHAKDLYPGTAQSCNTTPLELDEDRVGTVNGEEKTTPARILSKIEPVYPPEAKYQGTIVFSAIVSKSGDLDELGVKSAPFPFYDAARDAVSKWRFRSALLDGKPIDLQITIQITLKLGG